MQAPPASGIDKKYHQEDMLMKRQWRFSFLAAAAVAALGTSAALAQTVDTARIDAGGQNDWLTYHGSYKSYHYSPLAQISQHNVGHLGLAWSMDLEPLKNSATQPLAGSSRTDRSPRKPSAPPDDRSGSRRHRGDRRGT